MPIPVRPVSSGYMNAVYAALRQRGIHREEARPALSSAPVADTFTRVAQDVPAASDQAKRHAALLEQYGASIDMLDPSFGHLIGLRSLGLDHLTQNTEHVTGLIAALQAKGSLSPAEKSALQTLQRQQGLLPPLPPRPPVQPAVPPLLPPQPPLPPIPPNHLHAAAAAA